MTIKAVDLFCGVGGLTYGLQKAGIPVVAGIDIYDFRPEHPLDDEQQWHSSSRDDDGNLYMSKLSVDIFAQKIEYICDKLGYKKRTRQENKDHLSTLVKVTPR